MCNVILTEEIFKDLINNGSVCVVSGGIHTYIDMPSDLESKMIDIIEQKWVKEYGLDGEEKEGK